MHLSCGSYMFILGVWSYCENVGFQNAHSYTICSCAKRAKFERFWYPISQWKQDVEKLLICCGRLFQWRLTFNTLCCCILLWRLKIKHFWFNPKSVVKKSINLKRHLIVVFKSSSSVVQNRNWQLHWDLRVLQINICIFCTVVFGSTNIHHFVKKLHKMSC